MEKLIGKRIQLQRKKKGLTQDEFAEMLDITTHYLSALERGVYNIKLETLVKMLNILECSADEVFCDVVNKSYEVKTTELSERLNELPFNERNKILAVVNTMVDNATK